MPELWRPSHEKQRLAPHQCQPLPSPDMPGLWRPGKGPGRREAGKEGRLADQGAQGGMSAGKDLAKHAAGMELRLRHIRPSVDPLVWEELHAVRIMLSNLAHDMRPWWRKLWDKIGTPRKCR